MLKKNRRQVPLRTHDGQQSYILLQQGDVPSDLFSVMWVEMAPGSGQPPHQHGPEQAYIIIRGSGRMRVGHEEEEVSEGDIIYVPSNAVHTVQNLGPGPLTYLTVAAPAFNLASLFGTGELSSKPSPGQ
jgi:mannose-6-phosphate isomerase-like protein (cupin superfamily)